MMEEPLFTEEIRHLLQQVVQEQRGIAQSLEALLAAPEPLARLVDGDGELSAAPGGDAPLSWQDVAERVEQLCDGWYAVAQQYLAAFNRAEEHLKLRFAEGQFRALETGDDTSMEHAIHQRQLEHFTACYWIVSQFVGEIADADSRLQGTPFIGQARKPYFTTPQKIEPDKLPKQDWRYSSIISKSDEPLSTRYLPRGNGITLPPAFEEDGLLQTFQHIHTATLLQARMLEAIENLEPTLAETERQLRDAAEQTKPKNAKGAAAGAEPDSLFAGEGEPHLSFRQRLFSHIPGLRRGR